MSYCVLLLSMSQYKTASRYVFLNYLILFLHWAHQRSCPWAILLQSPDRVTGIFLSSSKELSLSYFVEKSRQSYWQIVELIKGIVLELIWFKSPESYLWQQRGYTFKETLTQTHIQNIVGWLELLVIFYSAQHFYHCIYFILINVTVGCTTPQY